MPQPTGSRTTDRVNAMRMLNLIGSVVYAFRLPDGTIKIGYSENLYERRGHLSGEILAVMFGTHHDEQAIHARLVQHRHHGQEYYHPTADVLAEVNDIRAHVGMQPLDVWPSARVRSRRVR